jgi:hypothetical protein
VGGSWNTRRLSLQSVRHRKGSVLNHFAAMKGTEHQWDLEEVIATEELDVRSTRAADLEAERSATSELLQQLAKEPKELFPALIATILKLTNAQSSGISILDDSQGSFVWPAVVGGLASYIGGGTPSDFGPCGTVLDRDAPVLFSHPERHFTYLRPIAPPLEEVLLVPFHMDGKPVGTVWAVIHEAGRQFDAEDRRLIENLSGLAASAYRVLTETGALKRILEKLPKPPQTERRLTNEDGNWRFKHE